MTRRFLFVNTVKDGTSVNRNRINCKIKQRGSMDFNDK